MHPRYSQVDARVSKSAPSGNKGPKDNTPRIAIDGINNLEESKPIDSARIFMKSWTVH